MRVTYWELRRNLRVVIRKLAEQKVKPYRGGHLMPDHGHIIMSIPPKYSVSHVIGYAPISIWLAPYSCGFGTVSADRHPTGAGM